MDGQDAELSGAIFDRLAAAAPTWLQQQRWFGAKSRVIDHAAVEDLLWLPGMPAWAVVVLRVHYRSGDAGFDRYALLIGATQQPPDAATAIARLPGTAGGWLVDAASDGAAVQALLRGLGGDAEVHGVRGGTLAYGDATAGARQILAGLEAGAIAAVGAEQSNTSVRIASSFVFKLFRRLHDGENPQLEMGRFLARSGFRAMPRLEGSIVYQSADGAGCALGALEAWIDNRGDGWRHVVAQLERATGEPAALGDLAVEMSGLGTVTGELHAALAADDETPAFAPVPVGAADAEAWRAQVAHQARRTLDLIARQHSHWAPPIAAVGRGLLEAASRATGLAPIASDLVTDLHQIRIHGDYHLGQTLKTANGFTIIDFEGEPARPLAERRQKHCALRDVAGMVRSFDYAVAAALVPEVDRGAWSAALRRSFLNGYAGPTAGLARRIVPAEVSRFETLLRVFELDKALYEVEYELNNRPDWAPIPLRALARLLEAA
jgi:maltose alpha-D-glucosyltransferase / alpha-amylase